MRLRFCPLWISRASRCRFELDVNPTWAALALDIASLKQWLDGKIYRIATAAKGMNLSLWSTRRKVPWPRSFAFETDVLNW